MNEGNITVVDVIATDDGYQLSRPAQDLYIAYEVVRRHIDSDGVRHYAQMSSAKITDDGYEFKFETGDVFTCASHEDRPASATVSDAIAGGSSDEPLIYDAIVRAGTSADLTAVGEMANPISHAVLTLYGIVLPDDTPDVPLYISVDGSEKEAVNFVNDVLLYDEFVGKKVIEAFNTAGDDTPYIVTYEKTSPALINLYDPNSEDTENYYPDGAYDSDNEVFALDVSAAYERLKRGQNVWIRWYNAGGVVVEQVLTYAVADDTLFCSTRFMEGGFRFTNYTGSDPEINPQPDPGE